VLYRIDKDDLILVSPRPVRKP